MSGGKGGSTTSKVEIPGWLEDSAKSALNRADDASRIGYVPYSGPDVAAFSDMQNAAFGNTNSAAQAFGMGGGQGGYMPQAETFRGGIQGHSSLPMFNEARQHLKQHRPNQYGSLMQHMVNPKRGKFTGGNS